MIQLLVCDDHEIVRKGLRLVLDEVADMLLVAEAGNGPQALQIVRHAHAASDPLTRIDLVVMDIGMPHRDGLDVLVQLRSEFPKLPVLVFSAYPGNQYAMRTIKLGAAGYLAKSAPVSTITAAIRRIAAGGLYISPDVVEQMARTMGAHAAASQPAALHETLSRREFQVFQLLARGRTVGEIAEQLVLSANTVSTYRARVLEKTGTRNDVELAIYAMKADLLLH